MGLFDTIRFVPHVLRRLTTGQVIATSEMTINCEMAVLRFTAKRDARSGEVYAIFALHASGRHEFAHLDASQVDELANVTRELQRVVRANRRDTGKGDGE